MQTMHVGRKRSVFSSTTRRPRPALRLAPSTCAGIQNSDADCSSSGRDGPAKKNYQLKRAVMRSPLPSYTNAAGDGSASPFHKVPLGLSAHTPMIFFRILSYSCGTWLISGTTGTVNCDRLPDLGPLRIPLPLEWKELVPNQIGIEVLGMTRVDNDDWIFVRFTTERCGDDTLRMLKPMQGWVPAFRSDGTPAAWFYSRGC